MRQLVKRVWGDVLEGAGTRVESAGVWSAAGCCGVEVLAMCGGGGSAVASAGGERLGRLRGGDGCVLLRDPWDKGVMLCE